MLVSTFFNAKSGVSTVHTRPASVLAQGNGTGQLVEWLEAVYGSQFFKCMQQSSRELFTLHIPQ